MLEIEKVKERLSQLDEPEARSLLLIIYARLDTTINGTGGDEVFKETAMDLFDIFKRLPSKQLPKSD
ncbi:hypothetical protein [Paenibacillus kribbensis]|uniref:hypothetical protein n=1 Tax=Paenibacillus kribbensis TaxID=172713 RepID=UPI000837F28A|nr:hypothetical protein [Paenibacillus kribbensis]